MLSVLPRTGLPVKYWFRATPTVIFNHLHEIARNGRVTLAELDQIRLGNGVRKERELLYYLASLYLLINEDHIAGELLAGVRAGSAMKRYFAVLNHCRRQSLPMPGLSRRQQQTLDCLDNRLSGQPDLVAHINRSGGFSVVGNAPVAHVPEHRENLCTFYFNQYQKNSAIRGVASVHVVTPSWQNYTHVQSEAVMLSGNSIFHRRSRVWERFADATHIAAIYTPPATLWADLSVKLGTSPTAGLLLLTWVENLVDSGVLNKDGLQGYIDGFSVTRPLVNHSYDDEAVSSRHNWALEPDLVCGVIERFSENISGFESPLLNTAQ